MSVLKVRQLYEWNEVTLALSDLVVGSTFKSPRLEVDESEALAFAKRFDPQPFHTDSAAAEDSLFKGLATSGWYTAAASFRLILDSGINLRGGIVGQRIKEMRWLSPLRPGDTLQVFTEVIDVTRSEKNPRQGTVTFKHVAVNGRQEPILEMRAVVLASDHDPVIPQFDWIVLL